MGFGFGRAQLSTYLSGLIPCLVLLHYVGEVPTDHPKNWSEEIERVVKREHQLVVCLLPTKQEARYKEIKKTIATRRPAPLQCVAVEYVPLLLRFCGTPV